MALPKPALDCMAGWTLPFNLLFLTFDLGSDLHHNLRDLSTFPSFLIFSNGVISPNKIVAYLTLCWHLLKNWWRTQTNIPSLVPNAQSLGLNSAVWPIGPFAIWLLLTSFFSLSLLLFCAPPTWFIHILSMLYHLLPLGLCTCYCFFQEYFFPQQSG